MQKNKLICIIFPDITHWERSVLKAVAHRMSDKIPVEIIDLPWNSRIDKAGMGSGNLVWAVTRNWQRALVVLNKLKPSKAYLSVLGLGVYRPFLPTLFLKRLRPTVTENVHLIAHSRLNYRFFNEIENIAQEQLSYVPLPYTEMQSAVESTKKSSKPVVGAFDCFERESNLTFLIGVAHCLHQQDPNVQFRIYGSGKLKPHLFSVIRDLEIEDAVEIVETVDPACIRNLDVFVYCPIRNDHFLPVLFAAANKVPVIASNLAGIEEYITDGKSGFVFPMNEIRPVAEMAAHMLVDNELRTKFGQVLHEDLSRRYSMDLLVQQFEEVILNTTSAPSVVQAA